MGFIVYGYKERSTGLWRYIGCSKNAKRRHKHHRENLYPIEEYEYEEFYDVGFQDEGWRLEKELIVQFAEHLDNIVHNRYMIQKKFIWQDESVPVHVRRRLLKANRGMREKESLLVRSEGTARPDYTVCCRGITINVYGAPKI